jgi:hypothetical protein
MHLRNGESANTNWVQNHKFTERKNIWSETPSLRVPKIRKLLRLRKVRQANKVRKCWDLRFSGTYLQDVLLYIE